MCKEKTKIGKRQSECTCNNKKREIHISTNRYLSLYFLCRCLGYKKKKKIQRIIYEKREAKRNNNKKINSTCWRK